MALVCSRYHIIRYKFAAIGFRQTFVHGCALGIRHDINTGPPRLYFTHIFKERLLVLKRPVFGSLQCFLEWLQHIRTISQ
jgi:hypothetical protein